MQKLQFLKSGLFLLILFCISCEKVQPAVGEYWGDIKATKNGKNWEKYLFTGMYMDNSTLFSLLFLRVDKLGQNREIIDIDRLPFKVATYNFKKEDYSNNTTFFSYGTLVSDGDVPGNSYELFESSNNIPNRLEITKIDTITKEIWGKFSANLVVTKRGENVSPDTVILTDGVFHAKLLKK
ncbi:MAG: hypothetical protein RLZZ292_3789 [Bacteroidota bacterium]|jgi:hypothetical protein